ncbi:MAG: hypothetical protein COV30_02245 [Candidatus Yanofskybacteria bacterium CG10_big_fil_rev_8_21_14_0_10_37_15]|uniref:Polymerase nucleotidyl transferase domain-containing protein n=1 Tax=Candidatus Yanofskybacteria bacterium CG10_big_fil_rev_8_21_14_0_10_37_15 TaxID=1975097 RepID=A0A2H0R7C5_9BACT|nr:MAG: hypothetical protein COV30_02245 [Candidatus Yanofskybacteria bacterium CG10_big_fil_rev_8_21_14_0_10_37_15]
MNHLSNPILATLIYYDIFNFPLTMLEVHKYLINPARLSKNAVVKTISLNQVLENLENLIQSRLIGSKNGFYFLSGRDFLCEIRIEREKKAAQKWKKFLKIGKWFQAVPYLRAILASGSLALNNTEEESDFDVLSVAKSGRLYTCRIFLSFVASLFKARRTRYQISAPDKFCFNHYIVDGNLNIKHESLFNAQTYVNLKPVFIEDELFENFYASNLWLNKYVYNFRPEKMFVRRSVRPSLVLRLVAAFGEFVLNNKFGDFLEKILKKYQHRRIKLNPVTYEKGGRIVFNDDELEFHPRSFEAKALTRYNEFLKRFRILFSEEEKDSGLE